MKIINKFLGIGQGTANTGNPTTEPTPSNFVGAILVPSGTVFTATQVLTLDTVLATMAKADNPLQRAYPITRFQEMTDESTEAKTFESGYGDTTQLQMGKPQWSFGLHKGLYSWSNLVEFDNQQSSWDVFFMDEQTNCLWGKSINNGIGGFPLNRLSIGLPKLNDSSTPFSHMITFGLKTAKDLQRFGLVQFGDDTDVVSMVSGLLTVNLSQTAITNVPATSVTPTIRLISAGSDLYDTYSADLADTSAWVATVNATGASVTVAAATVTGGGAKTWDIELTTAAASGTRIDLKLAAPSVLEGLGVVGYESDTLTVTIP